jgi:thiopeptide-type bacteriocin biosynthesis protein
MDREQFEDFYLLRLPAFSIDRFYQINDALESLYKDESLLYVKKEFGNSIFKEAIFLASKELYVSLNRWLDGEITDGKKQKKLLLSLHKYYTRMCTRCTPYGMFAGCHAGSLLPAESVVIFEQEKYRRMSRFDMSFSVDFAKFLMADDHLKNGKFYPNNTLYKIGDKYKYIEYTPAGKKRHYKMSSITASKYIDLIFRKAQYGATVKELLVAFQEFDFTHQQITIFIESLIESQFLTHELYPSLTGSDFLEHIFKYYEGKGEHQFVIGAFAALRDKLKSNPGLDVYLEADQLIREFTTINAENDTVQTDLFFNCQTNNLNEDALSPLLKSINTLNSYAKPAVPVELGDFKKRLFERYENQEIELFAALDPNTGLGYGLSLNGNVENMPLLNGILIPGAIASPASAPKFTKLIAKKYSEYKNSSDDVIKVTRTDLDGIFTKGGSKPHYHSYYNILGSIIAENTAAIDNKNYKFFPIEMGVPVATRLLGRFSHSDTKLAEKLDRCTDQQDSDYSDVLFAEIVHLPEDRIGNIVIRPVMGHYEIPFLASSHLPLENQIPVSDLLVSIRNDEVILRSKKLDKRIIPRLSSAHNYTKGLSVYRFLCDLQYQNVRMFPRWNWGGLYEEQYLPRVEFENIILSRARWLIKSFKNIKFSSDEQMISYLKTVIVNQSIPRYVSIQQNDNELPIDLESSFGLNHLLQMLQKGSISLQEFLFANDGCYITDEKEHYASEVLLTFKSAPPTVKPGLNPVYTKGIEPKRKFLPGDEWLYVKIYGGYKILDEIISNILKPYCEELLENGDIDKWFFIRYNDPDSHLRIRFHGQAPAFYFPLFLKINEMLTPLMSSGEIQKVVLDTYIREMERYFSFNIEHSESLFFHDSVACCQILEQLDGDQGEFYRWQMAHVSIDKLMDDFGLGDEEKYELTNKLQNSFFNEFNQQKPENTTGLKRSLNDKYRLNATAITEVLSATDNEDLVFLRQFYEIRSHSIQPISSAIRSAVEDHGISKEWYDELLASYIHMALNRLFMAKPRMHEMVVYHGLSKYYDSKLKRKSKLSLTELIKS